MRPFFLGKVWFSGFGSCPSWDAFRPEILEEVQNEVHWSSKSILVLGVKQNFTYSWHGFFSKKISRSRNCVSISQNCHIQRPNQSYRDRTLSCKTIEFKMKRRMHPSDMQTGHQNDRRQKNRQKPLLPQYLKSCHEKTTNDICKNSKMWLLSNAKPFSETPLNWSAKTNPFQLHLAANQNFKAFTEHCLHWAKQLLMPLC